VPDNAIYHLANALVQVSHVPDIMRAMARISDSMWPDVTVLPNMSTGATDGRMLRESGIPRYGVRGFFIERDDNRVHGRDERMLQQSFYEGQTFLYELVKEPVHRAVGQCTGQYQCNPCQGFGVRGASSPCRHQRRQLPLQRPRRNRRHQACTAAPLAL
jgi:hypothetical protein